MANDLVKAVACAWAEIDGKTYGNSEGDRCGYTEGYNVEAKELLCRSGLADRIEELEAENANMREIVEKAYHEGWGHGAISSGRRDMHNIHAEAARDWNKHSHARAALRDTGKEGE